MSEFFDNLHVADGDRVDPAQLPDAITAAPFLYDDGSTQSFDPDGTTIYVDQGRPTHGEWLVDDAGDFGSFWPPSYRAVYHVNWIVEANRVSGLRFSERGGGSHFDGRYDDR